MPAPFIWTASHCCSREKQVPDSGFAIPQVWTFADRGVAAGFESHVREQLPWYDLATNAVAHVARHYLGERGTVYDLGAATGNIGRALAPTLSARFGKLIPVEASREMADAYTGPHPKNLMLTRAEEIDVFESFDVAILFLTLMFIPPRFRLRLLRRLRAASDSGGAIIIFDKLEAASGYAATVLWRLTLAGKVASGVPADEIVAKELSLMGVQRPVNPAMLAEFGAIEFFRFGEFAGWLIET
jgi:tRNA (cmo5U34)-methyltransferase